MESSIQRLYYSITEVSKIIGEEQHVLRYWEREFSQLKPQKNRAGNRVYTKKDLEILQIIKKLLRDERYTVAGAKDHLRTFGSLGTDLEFIETEEAPQSPLQPNAYSSNKVDLAALKKIVGEIREISVGLRGKNALAS
ncbi:MAG: MerR family transcriptional regulator [Ignavibacteria bacterium]|nr:MerR family transcriptional regulator [Ignavibacteria bacterium]